MSAPLEPAKQTTTPPPDVYDDSPDAYQARRDTWLAAQEGS